jgi:hypothetical protein
MDHLVCVKPDKIDFSLICCRVINNLYPIVLSKLINTKKATALKYNLFSKAVFYKHFKQIQVFLQDFNNNVNLQNLLFSSIIFYF